MDGQAKKKKKKAFRPCGICNFIQGEKYLSN